MTEYRASSEPSARVTVGGLTLEPLHVMPALVFGVIGLVIALGIVAAAVRPAEHRALACSRSDKTIACEERSPRGVRSLSGPLSGVRFSRIGRPARDCLVVGESLACGVTRAEVDRVRTLADGGRLTFDASDGQPWIALVVGVLFAAMLLGLAALNFTRIAARRRRTEIVVTPRSLQIGTSHVVPRVQDERVEPIMLSRGRGEIPVWGIVYGRDQVVLVRLPTYKPMDLAPSILALSAALDSVPPAPARSMQP